MAAFNLSCDHKVSGPDKLFRSMKIGDLFATKEYPDKNSDASGDFLNLELKNRNNDYRKEISEMMSQSHDILDMLPSDPFDMNISARCTMIAGWFEGADGDIGYTTRKDATEVNKADDDRLFFGMNLLWTESTRICSGVGDIKILGKSVRDEICRDSLDGVHGGSVYKVSSYGEVLVSSNEGNEFLDDDGLRALSFAFRFLGVRDLLSVERVCKSLRDSVQNDPLLWRSIYIDPPLSITLTDDALLKITSRANGSLQCLSLIKCLKITDGGLKSVLERNPRLKKLCVPDCMGLGVCFLIYNLKALKTAGGGGLKYLRIGGLRHVTMHNFEMLKDVLSVDNQKQLISPKPRFYHTRRQYLSFDDDRPIDIEECPKCHQIKEVYDCPAGSCQGRHDACRGCASCIFRCIRCGCCLNGRDYMETFFLDFCCVDCLAQFVDFPESEEDTSVPSEQSIFHQQACYHVCFCG